MKLYSTLAPLALVLAAASLGALAADPASTSQRPTPKSLDTNGDGLISRDEAAAAPRLTRHFDRIDANHDGFLSRDELRAAHRQVRHHMMAARFRKLDQNGDGLISRDEAAGHPRLLNHFDQIDTNNDGFLSPDELRAAHQAVMAKGA